MALFRFLARIAFGAIFFTGGWGALTNPGRRPEMVSKTLPLPESDLMVRLNGAGVLGAGGGDGAPQPAGPLQQERQPDRRASDLRAERRRLIAALPSSSATGAPDRLVAQTTLTSTSAAAHATSMARSQCRIEAVPRAHKAPTSMPEYSDRKITALNRAMKPGGARRWTSVSPQTSNALPPTELTARSSRATSTRGMALNPVSASNSVAIAR